MSSDERGPTKQTVWMRKTVRTLVATAVHVGWLCCPCNERCPTRQVKDKTSSDEEDCTCTSCHVMRRKEPLRTRRSTAWTAYGYNNMVCDKKEQHQTAWTAYGYNKVACEQTRAALDTPVRTKRSTPWTTYGYTNVACNKKELHHTHHFVRGRLYGNC